MASHRNANATPSLFPGPVPEPPIDAMRAAYDTLNALQSFEHFMNTPVLRTCLKNIALNQMRRKRRPAADAVAAALNPPKEL